MKLTLENINRVYTTEDQSVHALKSCTIEFNSGSQYMIVGHSGSGKSTLLNILGLLDTGYSGNYFIDNVSMRKLTHQQKAYYRNKVFGYIFQEYALVEYETVYNNVQIPLLYSSVPTSQHGHYIDEILQKVGLIDVKNKLVRYLSGGQRQRVAIARSLVNKPSIILADEPTGSLDDKNRAIILDILYDYMDETKILCFVTHDLEKNRRGIQHVIYISDGELSTIDGT